MKNAQPRTKMSKRDKKTLDSKKRAVWSVKPVTRVRESRKVYKRLKKADYDI